MLMIRQLSGTYIHSPPISVNTALASRLTHVCFHSHCEAGRAALRQLSCTDMGYRAGPAGRQKYGLCFVRQSYCNWSTFQSPSISRRSSIIVDSICWISLGQAHELMHRSEMHYCSAFSCEMVFFSASCIG